ncbi:MAG: polysulfide reductase NrfD [Gallionellaceae bacterium]|nr:polysulfide reductase NrfD [Gallionellaceae bacterium]
MTTYDKVETRNFYLLVALSGLVAGMGLIAAYLMEEHGHVITGMNNQIVWGMPHVFAIFMIVAASGVLNVASVGSVFGKAAYKARAPLSSLLSIALLSGGLTVLMLDLGRADRLMVAMTNYNLTSVFAWNVVLYSGLFSLAAIYIWTMMEKRMNVWSKPAGFAVFAWRFILTTGTGLIFAFLVARQAYGSALLPPMFIVMSFAWGLAVFHVVQSSMYAWNGKTIDPEIHKRMRNLLGIFVIAVLYFVVAYHLTNLYFAKQTAFERFILVEGGVFAVLFWVGYVLLGSLLPLLLIFLPGLEKVRYTVMASLLVILGSIAFLYVFIIGGQAYPLSIFPGYETTSSFGDGQIASYAPSLPEFLLGLGGIGVAFLMTTICVRLLSMLPHDIPDRRKRDAL